MDIDKPRRLFQAVSDKDMKIAKIIIDSCNSPADIMNHKNNSQFTTLMQAVQLIPEDIAFQFTKLLVSKNAKIDLQNKFGQTALILAAAKGYSSIVCYLMENNCNYELRDKDGQTAFAVAQNDACRAPIKAAMDAKAAALRFEAMTKQGVQLNKFIVSNSIELAESLLEKQIGKFPELLMFEEEPGALLPFEIAFKNKNVAMMKLLLDYGVDVNLIPPRNSIYLLQDVYYNWKRIPSFPATEKSRQAEQLRVEVVNLFLKNRVDFEKYTDKEGRNLLFTALENQWYEDMGVLIEAGLSVNSKYVSRYPHRGHFAHRNLRGETPLLIAARKNDMKAVQILLQYEGVEVDALGHDGMTAALWAAYNGNVPILELLVAKNANLNLRTEEGYSALLLAINELKFDMMYYLIGCPGCDVEITHNNETTPLMLAVRKIVGPPKKFKTPVFPYIPLTPEMEELNTKIIKFIKVLVEERKAQVSKVTKHGFSAYYWAKLKNNAELMIYFRVATANQDIENAVLAELAAAKRE